MVYETLECDRIDVADGVTFVFRVKDARPPVSVTIPYFDWIDFGRPMQVSITVDPEE